MGEGKLSLSLLMGLELGEASGRALLNSPFGSILTWEQKSKQADVEKEEREYRDGSKGSLSAWSRNPLTPRSMTPWGEP